jgi:ADP-dependent NAD(P)H-hydrate dehydratase
MIAAINPAWLQSHPLPGPGEATDKNARGTLLAIGGSKVVPGIMRLVGEAAFRVGAGKVQLAVPGSAAIALGLSLPEAAVIGLECEDSGEIGGDLPVLHRERLGRSHALVIGPGMRQRSEITALLHGWLAGMNEGSAAVIDAGALIREALTRPDRLVLTPHPGELARLVGCERCEVEADPVRAARSTATLLGTTVVLKGRETIIAAPGDSLLSYRSEGSGLATSGSGDVLAGVIGGLLARGAAPLTAAAWGVWLHGEAGRNAAERIGPLGFLASDLLPLLPEGLAVAS